MATIDPSAWIVNGEKYALVGLTVKFEGDLPPGKVASNLPALVETTLSAPANWHEWLGSIRAGEVEDCNIFLISKMASTAPDMLDAENQKLQQRVLNFYAGLLLASHFAPAHRPVMLTGLCRDGEIGVCQQQDFEYPIPCLFRPYPPVVPDDIRLATVADFDPKHIHDGLLSRP